MKVLKITLFSGVVFLLFQIFSVFYLYGQEIRVRVIKEGAVVRLKPDSESMVIKSLPLGAYLDGDEIIGKWVKVKLPPGKKGAVVIGYILSSFVELENLEKAVEIEQRAFMKIETKPLAEVPARLTKPGGFRSFALNLTYGLVSTGPEDDREYYEGFSSGASYQMGVRYYFRKDDPRASRVFLGLSYSRSSLSVDTRPILLSWDDYGNELYAIFEPLTVQNIVLELGVSTSILGKYSHLFFLMGIGLSRNSAVAFGELRSPQGTLIGRTDAESTIDNQYPIRLKAGAVFGFSSRLGLEIDFLADILYGGTAENYWGQTYPDAKGGLLGVSIGLNFNL